MYTSLFFKKAVYKPENWQSFFYQKRTNLIMQQIIHFIFSTTNVLKQVFETKTLVSAPFHPLIS